MSDRDGNVTTAGHSPIRCQAVNDILARVGDKWSMQVVMGLAAGSLRFNALLRAVDGISQRMLTRTLRALERDGLVDRAVTPSVPPRVDYSLTMLGRSLIEPVGTLGAWAMENRAAVDAARSRFDAREGGSA
ncbi:winged helix-turn-helix transcriptional regulator [Croceibacterium aestuarii]|uniref:winged helix-turn-helix transcriptional regulator n=1 Tax=Croceibacterium aestuarii TaxID=3064139 RepID=UPI00272E047F|nr:helix-turn-helix domain-containing protein [Croceibacterium sp. D39]